MNIDQLAAEAMSLPCEARAQLADRLVQSLDDGDFGHNDKLWAAEARRRLLAVRLGLIQTISGEEAAARVRLAAGDDKP